MYRPDAIKVLSKGYEAKALQAQRDLLLNQVDTLKARIVIKENIIFNLNIQISDYKNIVQSHESIIATQKEQRSLLEQQIDQKNKDLKKLRRKTRLTAFAGILTTGLTAFLLLAK